MKTIGLLGGMSWESTRTYYEAINQEVRARCGGLHSAKIAMYSVDFDEIERLQKAGRWDQAGRVLAEAAKRVEAAAADFLVLCSNTTHRVAPEIEKAIGIPLLHIADATAEEVKGTSLHTVGLLGTKFTMEQDFYRGRLTSRHGLEVLIPAEPERELIHRVIYDELCMGRMLDDSREQYADIINNLAARGAEGIILGCTEISLLVAPEHSPLPLFDTTTIHARKAVDWALA